MAGKTEVGKSTEQTDQQIKPLAQIGRVLQPLEFVEHELVE
jgi:hypothetical protein